MRAIVFANGLLDRLPLSIEPITIKDLIIAADGGLRHCKMMNLIPHLIIGDLDSVDQMDLAKMRLSGSEVIQYPVRKDETDLELSLKIALERGAHEIVIIGALGARWDMTFSNVLILAADFLKNVHVRIVDGPQEMICIRKDHSITFKGRVGHGVSLFPLSESVDGITLLGMEYPLNNERLYLGSTRGLSNVIVDSIASIQVSKGILLALTGQYLL
ncbi:MAG: thiamine diphosphokinase [Candidatus Magnetomorum sp.]|nr:thiamine diphosphokinase [Candidatus Magnetomorum sp.]